MQSHTPTPGLTSTRLLFDALTGATGITVALAEEGPIPAVLAPAALAAAFLIDRPGRRGLPAVAAAALGLVGFGFAAWEAFSQSEEGLLLAGTHLLCYLLVVLLLQSKNAVDLGRMLILCVLLSAMGSLLTNSVWLAVGLAATLSLCVWSMIALQWLKMSGEAQRQTVEESPTRQLLGPAAYVAGVAVASGAVLFAVVPRIWTGQLTIFNNFPLPGTEAEVGFSEQVKLGDIGTVMENNEVVLTIESTGDGDRTLRYDEAAGSATPLLRGAVMGDYSDGTWRKVNPRASFALRVMPEASMRQQEGFVRHVFQLEPIGSDILFAPGDFRTAYGFMPDGGNVRPIFDPIRFGLLRPDSVPMTEPFQYNVYCFAGEMSPSPRWLLPMQAPAFAQATVDDAKRIDRRLAAALRDYAAENIAALAELPEDAQPSAVAEVIDAHLNEPGVFSYTLEKSVVDRGIDPVLDFLINRKSGHCEYYASAMTLLLRSRGVAARVVNGFKGGDWNEERQRYEVRQLHAHAWVEVLEPAVARWLAFDPTPASRDEAVAATSENARLGPGFMNSLRALWYEGIFMTRGKQRRAIYEPIGRAFVGVWATLRDYPDVFRAYWTGGRTADGREATLVQLLTPLIVLAVLIGVGILIVKAVRRRKRAAAAGGRSAKRSGAGEVRVPWYESFLKAAERVSGRGRRAADTPREYVAGLRGDAEKAAAVGERLTPAFYAARFGGRAVDPAEAERYAEEVAALDQPGS